MRLMRSFTEPSSSRIVWPVSAMKASSSVFVCVFSFERRGRALRDDFAVVDHGHVVRNAVSFLHVVRGEEDGHILAAAHLLDVAPNVVAGLRIEADRRLVEKKNFRLVQQSSSNFQAPLHAARIALHEIVPAVPEFHQLQKLLDARLSFAANRRRRDAVQVHIFESGQLVVEAGILKNDSESAAHLALLPHGVVPIDENRAAGGMKNGGEHLDRRRLAGAIGTEKAENLSPRHGKRNVIHGAKFAKTFHEIPHVDHLVHFVHERLSASSPRVPTGIGKLVLRSISAAKCEKHGRRMTSLASRTGIRSGPPFPRFSCPCHCDGIP